MHLCFVRVPFGDDVFHGKVEQIIDVMLCCGKAFIGFLHFRVYGVHFLLRVTGCIADRFHDHILVARGTFKIINQCFIKGTCREWRFGTAKFLP
ncbi:MAG: hypothetical protein KKH94_01655 [Candidatus Omnitrophica bacterium]|nr:hypothetical protein [Candidatus Omnitrophota bacterium]